MEILLKRTTPFIHVFADALRFLAAIADPLRVMYAVGLSTGMRPGEIRAMHSDDVHLERTPPTIHVHRQVYRSRLGPVKDSEARDVPVLLPRQPILREWIQREGTGFLFRPLVRTRGGHAGRPPTYIQEHTMWRHLSAALKAAVSRG